MIFTFLVKWWQYKRRNITIQWFCNHALSSGSFVKQTNWKSLASSRLLKRSCQQKPHYPFNTLCLLTFIFIERKGKKAHFTAAIKTLFMGTFLILSIYFDVFACTWKGIFASTNIWPQKRKVMRLFNMFPWNRSKQTNHRVKTKREYVFAHKSVR